MRIGVVTDIHSNLTALETVLSDMGEVDALWCLGDLVGYGPWPNEVVALLQEREATVIAGNHDLGAIGALSEEEFNYDAAEVTRWTATHLSAQSRAFLKSLVPTREVGGVTLAHASPRQPVWEYLLSAAGAAASFPCFDTQLCLVGHTHIPSLFVQQDHGRIGIGYMEAGTQVQLGSHRCIANPGSVGQPRDRDPRAAYLVLDTDAPSLEWRRVAYDIPTVQAEMRRLGLPQPFIDRLEHGM